MLKKMEIEVNGQKLWMDYETWWKEKEYLDWRVTLFPYTPTLEEHQQTIQMINNEWNKIITQKTT